MHRKYPVPAPVLVIDADMGKAEMAAEYVKHEGKVFGGMAAETMDSLVKAPSDSLDSLVKAPSDSMLPLVRHSMAGMAVTPVAPAAAL